MSGLSGAELSRVQNASAPNSDSVSTPLTMPDPKIELTAYSGYRGEEIPRSFIFNEEKIEVVSILDRWIEEGPSGGRRKRFFHIKGSDGHRYKVYFDEREKAWFLGAAG